MNSSSLSLLRRGLAPGSYTAAPASPMTAQPVDPSEFARAAAAGNCGPLFAALAAELRLIAGRIARGEAGHTMHPTALVNELVLRFFGGTPRSWSDQQHFVRWAATAMRYILLDHKKQKAAAKRGGNVVTEPLDGVIEHLEARSGADLAEVHAALAELEVLDAELAEYVSLRFFGSRTNPEVCRLLGISESKGNQHWLFARAWLQKRLKP